MSENWDYPAEHFDVPHIMLTDHERENVVAAYYAGLAAQNTTILVTSLEGRAVALDQIAGMVERLPAWRRRKRAWRKYLAGELRQEARRARSDLASARRRRSHETPANVDPSATMP